MDAPLIASISTPPPSKSLTFLKKLGTKISNLFTVSSPKLDKRDAQSVLDMTLLSTLQSPSKLAYTQSIFLLVDSALMAEALCQIELEYFKSVGWQELLAYSCLGSTDKACSSSSHDKQHSYCNLQAVIT